jgi:hypothetical protein
LPGFRENSKGVWVETKPGDLDHDGDVDGDDE